MTRQEKEAKEENRTNEIPQDSTLSPFGMNYYFTLQHYFVPYTPITKAYEISTCARKWLLIQKNSIVVSSAAELNRVDDDNTFDF